MRPEIVLLWVAWTVAVLALTTATIMIVVNRSALREFKRLSQQFVEMRLETDKLHQQALDTQRFVADGSKRLEDAYGVLMVIAQAPLDPAHKIAMAAEFLKSAGVSGTVEAHVVDPAHPPPVH